MYLYLDEKNYVVVRHSNPIKNNSYLIEVFYEGTIPDYDIYNEKLLYKDGGLIVCDIDEGLNAELTAEQSYNILLRHKIAEKKTLLRKYREDVEQVDLFGMERADYEEKKALCKQLVEELRNLERGEQL